ncbi:hypothetical protein C9374_000358 [Naegleria lovaniensis]|uniref:ubiquitinyl hydrolase 1 n=1 Tax=Naegleria lovaniensis TaxID=51637 RepID=A0AA88GZN6_NAELO|nr:uncharacterized protein C9374_000358 [Naegleria lovaniensis]KAG2388919.1 hypothetical protein C9374_000358 [Naegleria lovaniensis]
MISAIYHEKQEGRLCAMHSLNNLLQGAYFTEIDLMEIARNLDKKEAELLQESGTQQPQSTSHNVSDEGDFSIGVISTSLEVWGLSLIPITHPSIVQSIREKPWEEKAFICNHLEHWFVFRKFGIHWFNLNSTLKAPTYLSPTHISLFIEQLKQEGYSIYVVKGDLPPCEAELYSETFDPKSLTSRSRSSSSSSQPQQDNTIDFITQMQESIISGNSQSIPKPSPNINSEEWKKAVEFARMETMFWDANKHLTQPSTTQHSQQSIEDDEDDEDDEDEALKEAIKRSLEQK